MPAIESASQGEAVLVRIKAVPGASRDQLAGLLGDRLKVRVSAAPEGGKANKAICALIARRCGLRPNEVSVITGMTSPLKTVQISGLDADAVRRALLDPGV